MFSLQIIGHNNWILSMETKQIIYITQFTKVLFLRIRNSFKK